VTLDLGHLDNKSSPMRLVRARLPLLARGTSLLLNAIMAVVIARLFGAAASGEFFLAFATINFVGMLGRLGADLQAIKVLPGLFHTQQFAALWAELDWLRRYCRIGSSFAGTIAAAFGIGLWLSDISPAVGINLAILSISVPLSSASILESAALRSADRLSLGAFAETGLSQGLAIIFLLVSTQVFHAGAIAISICYVLSAVCTAAISRSWTRRAIPRVAAIGDIGRNTSSPAVRLAMLHMMGSSVLFFVLTSIPLFVLGIAATPRDVGLYNAATRVSTLIALIPALQTTYLIPRFARSLAGGDQASANRMLRRAARQATILTVLLAVGVMFFADTVLGVFGGDFVEARTTLSVLLVGQVVIVALGNVNPIMAVVGLERSSILFVAIALAAGIIPMAYAAAVGGAAGSALVFVLLSVAYAVACDVRLQKELGIRCFVS
jgi:O-antigen/teichoic acid export membrane protein